MKTKKKRFKFIVAVILFFSSITISYLVYQNSYIIFEPILFNGENYEKYVPKSKIEFHKRLGKVLKYYGEDFKSSKDGTILIKRKLQSDKETIYNYTSKSKDQ